MQKYIRPVLIGLVVGVFAWFVFNAIFTPGLGTSAFAIFCGVFTAYILANLAGNRKVADAGAEEKAAALALAPPPGQALLVAYRVGFVAKLAGLNLALDGREFAQLTAPKFTSLVVSPGAHTLTGAFGGLAGAQSKGAGFDFNAAPGSVTVVRINAQMGMVQGAVKFTPESDLAATRTKLAAMPMAAAALAPA